MTKFNYIFTLLVLAILGISFLGMWGIVKSSYSSSEEERSPISKTSISAEDKVEIKENVGEFFKKAGNFGVSDNIDLRNKDIIETIEEIKTGEAGEMMVSRQDVYNSLSIPRASNLYYSGNFNNSSEEGELTSFRLENLKIGKIASFVDDNELYAAVGVRYVSTETTRSFSQEGKTRTITVMSNTIPVKGFITMMLLGESWVAYDIDIDMPFTVALWEYSPGFFDIRSKGDIIEEIVLDLE